MPKLDHYRVFAGIFVCLKFTALAQTNSLLPDMQLFNVAAPHLRTESTAPSPPVTAPLLVHLPPTQPDMNDSQNNFRSWLVTDSGRKANAVYFSHHDFGLILPPKPLSRDPLTRGCDAIFQPEVFHIGRTATFSSSITTAIKRKNPLCLLNRIFLQVTW